jgi:hypothetical protein
MISSHFQHFVASMPVAMHATIFFLIFVVEGYLLICHVMSLAQNAVSNYTQLEHIHMTTVPTTSSLPTPQISSPVRSTARGTVHAKLLTQSEGGAGGAGAMSCISKHQH